MTKKAYIPSPDLKPVRIIPLHLQEKTLWNKEERTIDVSKYNQFMISRIAQVKKDLAEQDKKKKDLEWYQNFKSEQQVLKHWQDNNIMQDD